MKKTIDHIGVIGYGNVGSHMSHIFADTEHLKLTIYNRSHVPSAKIPKNAIFTQDLKELSNADFILIAVNDGAIIKILAEIKPLFSSETIVCHCSGSIASSVIKPYFENYGVIYPLQTFSREKNMDYSKIPVFITGSAPAVTSLIERVASHFTPNIFKIDDGQRTSLHIAAVFCCNYTNAMYSISEKICTDHNLDFKHLLPLIKETADKVNHLPPGKAQTGPAARGDWDIIQHHERYLSKYDPKINSIYHQLAEYINKNR